MKANYFEMLPPEIREVVLKCERLAQREVAVDLAPDHLKQQDQRFGHTVNLLRQGNSASILLNDPNPTTQALVHEVLHLKRAWLDRAWELAPKRQLRMDGKILRAVEEACRMIDETIEHAFWLIPEEKRLGVFDADIWNRDSNANLAKADTTTDTNARIRVAATEWIQAVRLVTDATIAEGWERKLKNWGLWDLACRYERSLITAFPDKRAMLKLSAEHLDISASLFEIFRYDFRTKKDEVRPL